MPIMIRRGDLNLTQIAALTFLLLPATARAMTLEFPGNTYLKAEQIEPVGSYAMPAGQWVQGNMAILTGEGEVIRQAWRIDASGLTTLQILTPLRDQLADQGFEVVFACETEGCGGFDFRFAQAVIPAPDMHVDLGDFQYLAARRNTGSENELLSLLVSRTSRAGFVQVTRVGPPTQGQAIAQTGAQALRTSGAETTGDFAEMLERDGHVVLSDLTFETGSAQLADAPFSSLQTLADYLFMNPDRSVALVGHTDSEGALDGNIALSKWRAGSVLERLVSDYGASRAQLQAEGMGFLAPVQSNLTPEGREANRRVEVILTSTD
jgi:outer membrane protein OmpA-like peptidoglycan-associated protein